MRIGDRDGLQGANRSNSSRYCEDWQRRGPPEAATAHPLEIVNTFSDC